MNIIEKISNNELVNLEVSELSSLLNVDLSKVEGISFDLSKNIMETLKSDKFKQDYKTLVANEVDLSKVYFEVPASTNDIDAVVAELSSFGLNILILNDVELEKYTEVVVRFIRKINLKETTSKILPCSIIIHQYIHELIQNVHTETPNIIKIENNLLNTLIKPTISEWEKFEGECFLALDRFKSNYTTVSNITLNQILDELSNDKNLNIK